MRKTCAFFLAIATSFAVQAEISTGSANVNVRGGGNVVFPEQDGTYSGVRVVAQMRETDPTIMDVTYIVYTNPETTPVVNVRALAFENGNRGFATVVRPETFVEGTEANIGDGIDANIEHRISWNVPSDWATDLAKVNFEVMAMKPGDLLLPDMHFVTIPAIGDRPKTVVSVNDLGAGRITISNRKPFNGFYERWCSGSYMFSEPYDLYGHPALLDACLWVYAGAQSDLRVINGELSCEGTALVRHAAFGCWYWADEPNRTFANRGGEWNLIKNAYRYIFRVMGYSLLEREQDLEWINNNTRYGMLCVDPRNRFRQYAVKTVDE